MAIFRMVAIVFIQMQVIAHGQKATYGIFEDDAVIFTLYNEETRESQLKYTFASPKRSNPDEKIELELFTETAPGEEDHYWGLTASYDGGKIFWNAYGAERLYEYDVKSAATRVIAEHATFGLENLAYDHVTKVLYWTDSTEKAIFATDKTREILVRIHEEGQLKPNALAIHVAKRRLYFSVYSSELAFIADSKLMSCDLDGGNQEALFRFPDIVQVNGITVDYKAEKLFWTDRGLSGNAVVLSSELDGSSRQEFYASTTRDFVGIANYKNYFYIADLVNSTGYEVLVRASNRKNTVIKMELMPRNVAVFAPDKSSKTKISNECKKNECDHMCLASSSGERTCRCSEGYNLIGGRCLTSLLDDNFLVVSDIGQEMVFQMALLEDGEEAEDIFAVPIHKKTKKGVTFALSLDPKTGELIWQDTLKNDLIWGDYVIKFEELVLYVDVDTCARRLYWNTDREIYSWSPGELQPTVVYSMPISEPPNIRHIALDYRRNHVYWTQYENMRETGDVYRIKTDGSGLEVVLRNMQPAEAITIDHESYVLHILGFTKGLLYSLPLDSMEQIRSTRPDFAEYEIQDLSPYLILGKNKYYDIAFVSGMVYIADRGLAGLQRYSMAEGPSSMERYGPWRFLHPTSIAFFSRSYYARNIAPLPACKTTEPTQRPVTRSTRRTTRPTTTRPTTTRPTTTRSTTTRSTTTRTTTTRSTTTRTTTTRSTTTRSTTTRPTTTRSTTTRRTTTRSTTPRTTPKSPPRVGPGIPTPPNFEKSEVCEFLLANVDKNPNLVQLYQFCNAIWLAGLQRLGGS